MVERTEPGSVGVVAGRVVGVLTTLLTVVGLLTHQETFYRSARLVLAGLESDLSLPVGLLFWGNVFLVAAGRYAFSYVLGSLLGVLYDVLDRPGIAFLLIAVALIGAVDGFYAAISARSVVVGAGFFLSWLAYVPLFAWLFENEPREREPVRL